MGPASFKDEIVGHANGESKTQPAEELNVTAVAMIMMELAVVVEIFDCKRNGGEQGGGHEIGDGDPILFVMSVAVALVVDMICTSESLAFIMADCVFFRCAHSLPNGRCAPTDLLNDPFGSSLQISCHRAVDIMRRDRLAKSIAHVQV